MKPNFALTLSFEGIRLLHRSGAGWTVVGEAPLDEPDLAGALAAMRATAVTIEPQGLRTKVLLPADQVKVLDAAEPGIEAARAVLQGATPYAVDDLVIDHAVAGGRNRVAAVWRGTLEEAEAFAAEHRFHPVSFAAVVPGGEFPGEAFFGESRIARAGAERVERDAAPTVPRGGPAAVGEEVAPAVSPADPAVPGPTPEPEPEPEGTAAGPAAGGVSGAPVAAEPPEPAAPLPAPQGPDVVAEVAARGAGPDGNAPAAPAPEPEATAAAQPPIDVAAGEGPATEAEPGADSDRAGRGAPLDPPVASGAAGAHSGTTPSEPAVPTFRSEAPLSDTGVPEPVFASRARPAIATEPVLVEASRVPLRAPARLTPARAGAAPGGFPRAEPPVMRSARVPQRGQPLQAPPPPSAGHRPPAARPIPPRSPQPRIAPASPAVGLAPAPVADPIPAPPPSRPAKARTAAAAPAPVVGRQRARPRFLGLILTALLLVVMLAVGLWASSIDEGLAGLFRRGAEAPEEVAAAPIPEAAATLAAAPRAADAGSAAPDPAPGPGATQAAAAAVAAALGALPAPEPVAVPRGTPVDPAEAERIYAATGVWLRAPAPPVVPRIVEDGGALAAATDAARPEATPAALALASADPPPTAPGLPPPAGSSSAGSTSARDGTGPIPATAEGTRTPSGTAVVAGAPPLVPPTRPGTLLPGEAAAAAEPPAAPAEADLANAIARPPSLRPSPRPADPVLPESMRPALAAATDGPAPVGTPGPVPGGIPTAALGSVAGAPGGQAEGATAGAVALAGFVGPRPSQRPAGLAPEAPPAPEVLSGFAGPRPGARPEGLAPEIAPESAPDTPPGTAVAHASEEPAGPDPAVEAAVAAAAAAAPPEAAPPEAAAPPAPDVQSTLASIMAGAPDPLAGATRQAVASARVPEARPRSFGRVVRDQLARAARAAQPAAAAAAAPAAPAAPRSGSPEEVEASDPEIASAAAAAPSGSTPAGVAQVATYADAMALREVNLIGVFGQPSDRRALVRMGNGSYLRVGVGDRLDGGQVTAIGDNVLNYTKRGRTLQLVIPGG